MDRRLIGFSLAAWSFSFAGVHVAWAFGWRWGVPADAPPIADRPWFLAYDVVAALLMYLAAGVAVLLARGGFPHRTRRLLAAATLVGSLMALGRGVPALVWDVSAGEITGVGFGADVWFTVAGGLGLMLWESVRRRDRQPPELCHVAASESGRFRRGARRARVDPRG